MSSKLRNGRLAQDANHPEGTHEEEPTAGSLPAFTDPAFSSEPATPAVLPDAPIHKGPPKDTEFAGHPDFSEEAAKNRPPEGMGLTEGTDENGSNTGKSEGVSVPVSRRDPA